MKEYNVGDVVWWAFCGTLPVTKECPVCYGKRRVTLILGNGEEFSVECDFCGKGYERARGYIEEYEWVADTKQIIIDAKEVHETPDGRKVEYRNEHFILRDGQLYDTKGEAEARVVELIAEHEVEQARNLSLRKEHNKNSYGWHVGYHKKQAAKARKDLEYHEAKAVAMKAIARTPIPDNHA